MDLGGDDSTQTRMSSTFFTRMGSERGYLVRIHPIALGEGFVELPAAGMIIGRDSDCGLVLEDKDVSRRHASIQPKDRGYVISDLNSTNGTLVNDAKIAETALRSGDLIRVGKSILKFLRGNDVETQYHETVYSMMVNDGLTGIPNKRFLQDAFQRELVRSQRHHRPLSVAVIDIDHFKAINDQYGHLAGDSVLREICRRIRRTIRRDEVFARYGGEEFVVLLPESSLEQSRRFAERILHLINSASMDVAGNQISVTVSIGLAHTDGELDLTPEKLFEKADQKLYEAKNAGRNRVAE